MFDKICANCEFHFPVDEGFMCAAGRRYGEFTDDDDTCEDWELSFSVYMDSDE